jgi:two-component sensor histidine kinase
MLARPPSIDFETLFGASPNPYVLVSPELVIVTMNDAYLATTMRERDNLVGKPLFEAFPSDPDSESHKALQNSFARVIQTGERDEIALIRYDIPRPSGAYEERYWSATHTPLFVEGKLAFILQHTVDVTELHRLRTFAAEAGHYARDETGVFKRAHAVQEANQSLAQETQRLRTLFEQAPGFIAVIAGPDLRFQLANVAYRRLVNGRDVVGKTVAEALPEVVNQGFVTLLDQVRTTGEPYIGRSVGVMLEADCGGPLEERFLNFVYQPITAPDGETTGVFVQGHDVTDQRRAEEHQQLLIHELNHRVKNTLSIVQALAMQSFNDRTDASAARETFDARLNALSAAHSLLTTQNWERAGLFDIIGSSVSATAGANASRVSIYGPDIAVAPQTAVSLAMAIHELCTNAIKYGALSNATGTVDVRWTAMRAGDGSIDLVIDWSEAGGPPVETPSRRGFGTRLIERGLSAELRSTVTLDFHPAGVKCTILAKLPAVAE